ncbi:MAG: hypothetical protein HC886_09070 [Leptolyngbyaceae cyanobacterium SM1_1_3]|nr:hypothetical protein [Leptolyngbyaceae cyanobacterium SM1_1_3]
MGVSRNRHEPRWFQEHKLASINFLGRCWRFGRRQPAANTSPVDKHDKENNQPRTHASLPSSNDFEPAI